MVLPSRRATQGPSPERHRYPLLTNYAQEEVFLETEEPATGIFSRRGQVGRAGDTAMSEGHYVMVVALNQEIQPLQARVLPMW